MYSDLGNASPMFEIRSKLKEMKQGSESVTQYFSDLQELLKELDLFFEEDHACVTCSVKLRKHLEKERVFDFLAGVNRYLDEVRGRVVARDPLPSPEDAFAEVRREEIHRKVILPEAILELPNVPEGFALILHKHPSSAKFHFDSKSSNRPICEYCHYPGHRISVGNFMANNQIGSRKGCQSLSNSICNWEIWFHFCAFDPGTT